MPSSSSRANGPGLKPTNFGTTGTYRNLSTYKKAVLDAITDRASEFNAVHSKYEEYLKWLVDNATGDGTFFDQKLFDALKTTQPNSWNELNVYFIEVLGPIYIIEQLGLFKSSKEIDVPESAIQGAYDFAVDGAQISVKKSGGGKTNTLKPGDIVANKPFKDFISGLPKTNKKKKIFQIFEVLNEHSALDGPIRLLYGTDNTNGLLKQLKPKGGKWNDQNFMLNPKTGEVSKTAKELYANDVETSINRWSTQTANADAMREFNGDYLLYSGLGLFTISISDKNGRATANYSTTPSGSSLAGKGRASFRYGRDGQLKMAKGEKMGISMKF